jgi:hypothetical protein
MLITINNMASNRANAARGSPPHTNLAAAHLRAAGQAQQKAHQVHKGWYDKVTKRVDEQKLQKRLNVTAKYLERDTVDLFSQVCF